MRPKRESMARRRHQGFFGRGRVSIARAPMRHRHSQKACSFRRGFRAFRRDAAMTDRILEFLCTRREEEPCLVLDFDVVRDNYAAFPN
jgi:hypothetical protein